VLADLDDLLTTLYVLVDDLLPAGRGAGRRPRITAAELITLAVAQILLQCHSERRFLRELRFRFVARAATRSRLLLRLIVGRK
jgi:hypothetical protein